MRILCVDDDDNHRSPVFAALLALHLKHLDCKDFVVESAGYLEEAKGHSIDPSWPALLGDSGVDLKWHISRWVGDLDLTSYERIICLDSRAYDEVSKVDLPRTDVTRIRRRDGEILSPKGHSMDTYRDSLRFIKEAVVRLREPALR